MRRCGGSSGVSTLKTPGDPYFAVATVLDGSAQGPYLLRRGPLWKAVRASGSLPAVLPPVLTEDGRLLVDGGLVDNVPLGSMKTLKGGPNLVVHFGLRDMQQRFEADYMTIPGRWGLLRQMLTPGGRRKLASRAQPHCGAAALSGDEPEPRLAAGRPTRPRAYGAEPAGREFHGFRSSLRGFRGGLPMVP